MGPTVEGNRPADEMQAEEQGMCRRVRLTVRLGPTSDTLEKEKLVIAKVKILDVSTGRKATVLKQTLGRNVGTVGGNVKLRLRTPPLKLRKQGASNPGTATAHPDHEQRDEALLEERVVQDAEAEDLIDIYSHDTIARRYGGLDKLSAIRVGSHEGIDEANAGEVHRVGCERYGDDASRAPAWALTLKVTGPPTRCRPKIKACAGGTG